MSENKPIKFDDYIGPPDQTAGESRVDKLAREAYLLSYGTASGFVKSAGDVFEHPTESGTKFASSVAVGALMAFLTRGGSLRSQLGKTAAVVMTGQLVADMADSNRLLAMKGAIDDTWESTRNFDKNLQTIQNTAGKYAFDMGAIGLGGGALGLKLGNHFFAPASVMPLPLHENSVRFATDGVKPIEPLAKIEAAKPIERIAITDKLEPLNVSSRSTEQVGRDMSNFAHTPFTLDGKRYASVEGFYQGLRYVDAADRKAVGKLFGKEAKHASKGAQTSDVTTYGGKELVLGSDEHHSLIQRAIAAKLDAHPKLAQAFKETYPRPIIHDTGVPDHPNTHLSSEKFASILTTLRENLAAGDKAASAGKTMKLTDLLGEIKDPEVLRDHPVADYMTAFRNLDFKPLRMMHAGGDSLVFELENDRVLKLTQRALAPEMGTRPFDLPIVERGTQASAGGKAMTYFVQPKVAEVAGPADLAELNKIVLNNGYHLWDPSPGQAGRIGPTRELKLLDPFAVHKNDVTLPNLYE